MARQVNGTSHKAEKQGSGVGGGPVGNSGGYSGRPGGNNPAGPSQERAGGAGNNTSNLALAGILALLLGKNGKNGKSSPVRIIILAVIIFLVLKSCSGGSVYNTVDTGMTNYAATTVSTPAPTPKPTPVPATPAPTAVPAPASASAFGSLADIISNYTGSFGSNTGSYAGSTSSSPSANADYSSALSSLLGGYSSVNSGSYSSSGWINGSNCGNLNTSVLQGSRAKFTSLRGNGRDTATIMIYMCGTDLESGSGMATSDLQEIASAPIADNVNILVYTGGCTGWKNNLMSNKTNQIYKIENGGRFVCLNDNVGNLPMISADTLSSFIQFCGKNYPADRNMLIFWDHGGGSITGYGYDQRYKSSGSMSLDGINKALANGGVKFDFVGFDACLMATEETAEVVSQYADYLIASEESEPGIGWYYTNWLTKLSNNTSASTLEIGKQIIDDFVDVCAQKCRGQDTTLSLIDLAEFSATVPQLLKNWANATTETIKTDYRTISNARSGSKEFAADSRIDQVDLACLAYNINDQASQQLAKAILSAVKYNRTSSTVKNAYGLSIFFPYRSASSVKKAISTYNAVGLDSSYSKCIQAYATYASSGQASSYSNGYSSPLGSLLSGYGGSGYSSGYGSGYSSGYSGYGSSGTTGYSLADIAGLLSGYGTSSYGNSGYGSSSSGYSTSYSSTNDIYSLLSQMMSGGRDLGGFESGTLDQRSVAEYLSDNRFNASALVWTRGEDGRLQISLPADQWELVDELKLSVFRDDGKGFIDLGLDLSGDYFNESGALTGEYDRVWLALNENECAYYQLYTMAGDNGETFTRGYIPCLYNGVRAKLIVDVVNDEPSVVGYVYDYVDGETDARAKTITEYSSSDRIQLIADYYTYDNSYENTYAIADEFTIGEGLEVSYMYVADPAEISACYRFVDIYGQSYWTPVMALADE